jgi:hypothetical protein
MSTPDTHDKYAITGGWGESPYQDVTVPSGQVCLVKKISMEDLVVLDIARDVDTPTAIASQNVAKAQGKVPTDRKPKTATKAEALKSEQDKAAQVAADVAADPEAFKKHVNLIGKIVCFAVQKPEIHPVPAPDPMNRVDGRIYVDSINFNDQVALFEFAMSSTRDAETFREEPATDVGNVADVEDLPLPPE